MIAAQYRPQRIYQWGSLVHTERFSATYYTVLETLFVRLRKEDRAQ